MRRTLLALALLPNLAVAAVPDVIARHATGAEARGDAAVVIGIEDYAFLPDVPFAMRDAEAFYSFLVYTRGIPPTKVSLLSRSPTAKEIREAVEAAAAQVGAGGTLWFYFAGHGAANPSSGERILLGVDIQGKAGSLQESAYAFAVSEFDKIAARSQGADAVMVVDSCYAGAGRGGEPLLDGKRFAVPVQATAPAPKVTHWFATSADELSGPYRDAQHGLFTYFTVGALRGWADGELDGRRDGKVTLAEAQQYVSGAVRTMGGGEQVPTREDRADLTARVLSPGREQGPDLGALTLSRTKPSVSVPGAGTAVVQTGGDDYLAKLEELKRLKAEREATAAREAELLAAVDAERAVRIDAARQKLLGQAAQAWSATQGMLTDRGEESRLAVQAFLETFGSATIAIDGQQIAVEIPEVNQARVWLAETQMAAAQTAISQAAAQVSPAAAAGTPPWVNNPAWDGGYRAWLAAGPPDDPASRKWFRKADAAGTDDEKIGDLADKARERGLNEVALHLYHQARENDASDSEWSGKLVELAPNYDLAMGFLVQAVRRDPGSDERQGDLGDASSSAGQSGWACYQWRIAHDLDAADAEWTRKLEGCGGAGAAPSAAVAVAPSAAGGNVLDRLRQAGFGSLAGDLSANPSNDEMWGDAGDTLSQGGQAALALEVYFYALALDEDDGEWATKAQALGGGERLVGMLAGAVARNPSNDELLGNYGDALLAVGRGNEACAQWARAGQVDPADSEWQRKIGECRGGAAVSAPVASVGASAEALLVSAGRFGAEVAAVRANPQNDEVWGDLADAARGAGDNSLAVNLYFQALSLDTDDGEWATKITELGGAARLVDVLAGVIAANPGQDELLGNYGDALASVGRRADACDAYRRAAAADPADSEWQRKVGECGGGAAALPPGSSEHLGTDMNAVLSAAGGYPVQVAALRGDPRNDELWGDLGDAARDGGQLALARSAWLIALSYDGDDSEWPDKLNNSGGGAEVVAILERSSRDYPSSDEVWGNFGDALVTVGRTADACNAYRRASGLDSADAEWTRKIGERCGGGAVIAPTSGAIPSDEEGLKAAAASALASGDRARALDLYRRALALSPGNGELQYRVAVLSGEDRIRVLDSVKANNDEIWGDLGDAMFDLGRFSEAAAAWGSAHRFDPADGEWTRKLTMVLAPGSAEANQLIADARARAAADTGDEATGDYGDVLAWLGRWEEGCQSWREASRRDPGDSEWQNKVARCVSTSVLESRFYAEQSDDIAGALALMALSRGDRSGALQWFSRALELDPVDVEWRTRVVQLSGQTHVALLDRLAPQSSSDELVGDYGDVLFVAGRRAEAAAAWKRARTLDPGDGEWQWKATLLD